MPLRLRAMRADELPGFLDRAGSYFAAGLAESWGVPVDEVEERARADAAGLLDAGVESEGQHLLVAEDEDGTAVAQAWLGRSERDGPAAAFLFDVMVEEAARGRGLGRETMLLVEAHARELGFDRIGLNVFPVNEPALGLYRSLGYREVAFFLGKKLAGD